MGVIYICTKMFLNVLKLKQLFRTRLITTFTKQRIFIKEYFLNNERETITMK